MATNTFELSAQMVLFADKKGRGAARLITPAYNIGQKINQFKKLTEKYDGKLTENLIQSQVDAIVAVAKPDGKLKADNVSTNSTWGSITIEALLDESNYKDLSEYAGADDTEKGAAQKAAQTDFDEQTKSFVKLYVGLNRIKEDIEKGFSNLASDTKALIKSGTGENSDPEIAAALTGTDIFYKAGANATDPATGLLPALMKMEYPAEDDFTAFLDALDTIQNDANNGDITFSLLTAKKTQGDSVIKTEQPIKVNKTTIIKSFKLDKDGKFVKAIPTETKLDLLMDFDTGEAKFGVEANFGDDFIANGKPDIFYLNQGIITFIRNVNKQS